jgi:hypothetical protein
MDRQGGGPMKWSEFYGRTAEKFFYHPTDPNTKYHTRTVLQQRGPQADNKVGGGVPASQGLPVHQRPPQFDYIYRANQDAKTKAEREAVEARYKADELIARRATLEAEQSALWCEVAFRAVSRYDLARKPLYRFEPIAVSVETNDRQRAEALKAAAIFMRAALLILAEAEKDQARAFGSVKATVADAREKLDDNWIRQAVLASDMSDMKTPAGKFVVLAKRLDDVAANLSESYQVSIDGERFKDEQRKDTFRALLQESLVSYAQVVLALDEMSSLMATEWKIRPDVDRPIQAISLLVRAEPSSTRPTNNGATVGTSSPASSGSDDIVQSKTVWSNDKLTFTILERRGDWYRATFASSQSVREVVGTVKGGKLSWLAKDVRVLKGQSPGGDNYGTIRGEEIDFQFEHPSTKGPRGTFTLKLKKASH